VLHLLCCIFCAASFALHLLRSSFVLHLLRCIFSAEFVSVHFMLHLL
jgi:hypothetical protein